MSPDDQRSAINEQASIDWSKADRILVVKLRSIGDAVLATPSLIALRRFLPTAQIDILLEDWVAPLLEGHDAVNSVITVGKGMFERLRVASALRRRRYDIAFNLHGGTTATFFTAASGARQRVGFENYRFGYLYNHRLSSASDYWQAEFTHSAEQQLALLGFVGVPVKDRPKTRLTVSSEALMSLSERDPERHFEDPFVLMHPASAFATKQWSTENFARTAEYLADQGLKTVAVASKGEKKVLTDLVGASRVRITVFDDLSLPEITALASKAELFVGNDSGIAHIAAAVETPSIVIFGSSNRNHWRPWTNAANQIVFKEFACQPCAGHECKEFGRPRCIREVPPSSVISAIQRLLAMC